MTMFTKSRTRLWRLTAYGGTVLATALAVAASTQAGVTAAQASVGPPSDESGNISASFHPTGTREDVFYVGPHGQIYRWQHRSGHWFNGPIGAGESAEPGSGVAAVWSPDGSSLNVFYVGANLQIYTWQYQNGTFTNGPVGTSAGEPAEPGTGLTAIYSANQVFEDVFYVGANGHIYAWSRVNGGAFSNGELSTGTSAGEASEPGTGVTAVWSPDDTTLNLFYDGANSQIYTWQYHAGGWANSQLGTGETAEPGTSLTSAYSPNQVFEDVFYVGTSGHIYAWSRVNGGNWGNGELSTGTSAGEAAETGTGLSAVWQPNGTTLNTNYIGANGQIYTWQYHAGAFTNSPLGTGEPAQQGSGVPLVWQPNGLQANLFYKGANGHMYNWYGNGTTFTNGPL